jgi:hypothetical protein
MYYRANWGEEQDDGTFLQISSSIIKIHRKTISYLLP